MSVVWCGGNNEKDLFYISKFFESSVPTVQ
jgi:hypothetical protein